MSRLYLLDTNIVSELAKNPQGRVRDRIAEVGPSGICVSIITAAELRYDCAKKASPRLTAQIAALLAAIKVLPLEAPADSHYGALRAALEQLGTPIGPNDLLIAAHARAVGAVLVTANIGEFGRVPGLAVEAW